jgi:hypothetical protein
MLKQPLSADPNTGTDLMQHNRADAEPDKFIIREKYGIETLQSAGQRQAELDILGQKVLAVVDGSASGRVSFSEVVRTDPRRDWASAVRHLINLRVLSHYAAPNRNGSEFPQLNDYVWRYEPRRKKRRR